MPTLPLLELVIPVHPSDQEHLTRLLQSINQQSYPKARLKVHLITEGNSEEAKAIGILQCHGDIVGMLCADNVLLEPNFLEVMVDAASQPQVVGAYTAQYAYVKEDTSLSRYFALLGANDPLCWWLGKADRESYLDAWGSRLKHQLSLGDNGCFFKRQALQLVVKTPETFGSCMCICEDLRRLGLFTYSITPNTIWHRTGSSFWRYLKKRWRYTNALYWQKRSLRRWHLVSSLRDWTAVVLFTLASLLVVPHLLLSIRGYRQKPDWAWCWHPLICLTLTFLYASALIKWGIKRFLSSFQH